MDTHDRKQPHEPTEEIASVDEGRPIIDTFGMLIFFVIVAQIVLLIGINLYQNSRIKTLNGKLAAAKETLAKPENRVINNQIDEVLDGSERLKTVLATKTKWSRFYTLLNAVTPNNVRVSGISISETGFYRAEGTTTSLSELGHLITTWKEGTEVVCSPFSTADLISNGFTDQNAVRVVSFTISGQVNTAELNKDLEKVKECL